MLGTAAAATSTHAAFAAAPAYASPPPVHHLAHAPTTLRITTLPAQLKRLAYIVSLVLGGSAVVAGIWSAFLLPLLHATFSARAALVAPQRERWRAIVDRLREIRVMDIFTDVVEDDEARSVVSVRSGAGGELVRARTRDSERKDAKDKDAGKDKDTGKDLALARTTAVPDSPRSASIHTAADALLDSEPGPAKLFGDVSPLSSALRDLASSLDATATTRTSLVSTLETYTGGLHREIFARGVGASSSNPWAGVPGAATGKVGLGTLGANLAKAGGGIGGGSSPHGHGHGHGHETSPMGLPAAKSEEWDAVRREVRAIKGMLLNRRNFTLPPRTPA